MNLIFLVDYFSFLPATSPDVETYSNENEPIVPPTRIEGKSKKEPSVWRTLLRTFGPYYLLGGSFKLVYDMITFVNPMILR
jgi:hypothetical protein